MTMDVVERSVTRAEQVLLAILDAQSVDVADIRAALDELAALRPQPEAPSESRLRRATQAVVDGLDAWNRGFDNDRDAEFEWISDPIDELRLVLAGVLP